MYFCHGSPRVLSLETEVDDAPVSILISHDATLFLALAMRSITLWALKVFAERLLQRDSDLNILLASASTCSNR